MARRKERTQTKPQIAPSTPPHASAIDRRQPHPANVFVFRPHLPSPSPKPRSTELRSRLRNIDLHRHRRLLAIGLHRRHLPVIVGFHSPPRSSPAVRPRVCAFASAASPFPDRRRPAAPPPVGSVAAAARLPLFHMRVVRVRLRHRRTSRRTADLRLGKAFSCERAQPSPHLCQGPAFAGPAVIGIVNHCGVGSNKCIG